TSDHCVEVLNIVCQEFQLASEQTPCSVWVSFGEGIFWHNG
ncbi:hypothetical protein A2U01_0110096, partial [Trifolium medium]|nr:hypothetical protein [Trifolium medium]